MTLTRALGGDIRNFDLEYSEKKLGTMDLSVVFSVSY